MARISIQYRSDFSVAALLAGWFVLSLTPGIMVWVLGLSVPRWEFFPAPMINGVAYPNPAYASLLTSLVIGVLAPIQLSKAMIISGINGFWRAIAIAMSISCIAFLATMNPFVASNYAGQVASQVMMLGDWVVIAAVGTTTSFLFSLSLTTGISRQR